MVKITKICEDDLRFLNETRNLVSEEFLHDSRKFTYEECLDWFRKFDPDYRIIWIDHERVGYFRLSSHSTINRNIYIGADIHPSFQGKGYAKQAYSKFIPELFEEYDLHKISLEVLSTNHKAIALYEKIGFKYEGAKRDEVLKGETFIDSIIMSILRKEYESK